MASPDVLLQRPYRGSRVSSFYPVKSLPPLASLDSAFQLQEYISLLIRLDVHDVDAIVSLPEKPTQRDSDDTQDPQDIDTKKSDDADRKSDVPVDRACWVYEQLRRLAQDLSHPLITMLQQECTRSSCPQMKAGEWLYLCVAHGNDGAMEQCCAIDYILHTVDSATALLNSPRTFPSRLSIPQTSHRHFSSLARRLGRIFAHAFFHHREAFEQAEAESSLYARFLKLTSQFDLVPAEFLVIPESAIHHDDKAHAEEVEPPRLFSAAVHPASNLQNDTLITDAAPDPGQLQNSRQRAVEVAHQYGMDSPRRLGRSRTDTMVFSEAFSVVEELSKGEDGGRSDDVGLLDDSPITEVDPLVAGHAWADLHASTEGLDDDDDDDDVGDARSEVTLTGPLSPPVEALSLISLEDTPGKPTSDGVASSLSSETSSQEPSSDDAAMESGLEETDQVVNELEEHPPADEPPPAHEDVEPASEEVNSVSSESLTETGRVLPEPEETINELVDFAMSSGDEELEKVETKVEFEIPPPPDSVLELNEPPPSEPIPPESESDITDEVGGLDGDEVRDGGEEAAVGE